MQTWGSEFLDTECYVQHPPPPIDPVTSDPWRIQSRWGPCIMVRRLYLEGVAQPERIRFCEGEDREKTDLVRAELLAEGLREPLELVIRLNQIVLRDGHHRLVASRDIPHFDMLPCFITPADAARPLADQLGELIFWASPA